MRNIWADKWYAFQIAINPDDGFAAGEMDLALYERFVALRKRGLIGPLLVGCGKFRIGVDEITGSWEGSRPVSLADIRTVIRCIERDNPERMAA